MLNVAAKKKYFSFVLLVFVGGRCSVVVLGHPHFLYYERRAKKKAYCVFFYVKFKLFLDYRIFIVLWKNGVNLLACVLYVKVKMYVFFPTFRIVDT